MPEGPLLSCNDASLRLNFHEPSEEISCTQPIEKPTRLTLDNRSPHTRKGNIFVLFLNRNRRHFLCVCPLSGKCIRKEFPGELEAVGRNPVTHAP